MVDAPYAPRKMLKNPASDGIKPPLKIHIVTSKTDFPSSVVQNPLRNNAPQAEIWGFNPRGGLNSQGGLIFLGGHLTFSKKTTGTYQKGGLNLLLQKKLGGTYP